MQVKLKSASKLTRFLLAHGEKIGIVAVLLCALLLIWKSLGRERLADNIQPVQLSEKANSAQTHFMSLKPDDFPPGEIVRAADPAKLGESAIAPIPSNGYKNISPLNPRVTDPVGQRMDPVLLAPADLEVHGGSGLWATSDPETIKRKAAEAIAKQQAEQAQAEEERKAEEAAADQRRGPGGRGPGGRGSGGRGGAYSGGGYEGGRGGGYGGAGAIGIDGKTKDGALVIRPSGGVQTQGFEDIKLRSWVTVLAKVPVQEEFQKYVDALQNAHGYSEQDDVPIYKGYEVQRADVTDAGTSDWTTVARITEPSLLRAMSSWPTQTPEPVNPKYVHPLLTYPLPPMVLRGWGADVTHSDMPLPTPEDLMNTYGRGEGPEQPAPADDKTKKGEEGAGSPFDEATKRETPQDLGPGAYGRGGRGESGGGRGLGGRMTGRGGGEYGGGRGGESGGRGGRGGRGGGTGPEALPAFNWDGQTEFVLFRYFDPNVKPGSRYQYRVRLVLDDVNLGKPERYIDKTVIDRMAKGPKLKDGKPIAYRFSEWSEPSPIAVVPQPGLIYLAGAKPAAPGNYSAEPEAQLVIKTLDGSNAAEAAIAANKVTRGTVINLSQKAEIIWSSTFQDVDANDKPVESPTFDFSTGTTVLDFEGGQQLNKSRDYLAPARALVMDSAGRMKVENELDDQAPVSEYKMIKDAGADQEKQRAPAPTRGPGSAPGRGFGPARGR